ncbi:TIGR04255 family protein [Gordonia sp. TBRC 11910]|uniref:TIGR04255 family protein n=1 Tax=Gordonia asplenii TaxID=2725283 RepID=A0A848KUR9_9ACTN|nr:TIGR04255 family protein [Gordonia asplenii]NMO01767.1 TIGR04255 family protein [Gordonia asplenii]
MATIPNPFAAKEPGNIPLPKAPLLRTIAQVRFPQMAKFASNEDGVATAIAGALADDYPLIEAGREVAVTLTPDGMSQSNPSSRLWRLTSADGSRQVSFGATFLSVDSTTYTHRSEFAQWVDGAWEALAAEIPIPYITRLGVRYINQLTDQKHLDRLSELFRPAVLGVAMAEKDDAAQLASSITETQYQLADGARFTARYGLLPKGTVIDTASSPYDYPTCVFDTDSYREFDAGAKQPDNLVDEVKDLALNGYRFFRWSVTDDFLSAFGGEL